MGMMLLLALVVLLVSTSVSGFNITRILDQHSDFGNFNSLLTETGVADAINSRQTITVLVVDNSAIGGLNGKGRDFVRNVIATHVVLDYYDMDKLGELNKNGSAILTTLFQSTGLANDRQGFLNVTVNLNHIVFGSAVRNAQRNANLIEVVAAQPYNISVIHVSSIIVPPGFDQGNSPPAMSPPPRKVGPPPPADAPTPKSKAPDADADSSADDTSSADAPESEAESASESGSAPGPAGDDDDDAADKKKDDKEKKKSSGRRVASSGFLVAAAVMVCLVAL